MKKITFFALVMFMSVIGAVFGQTPATLPYSCDFEAAGDNGWTLKNGTCTSKWHVGSFTSPAGYSGSLFISSDGGTTADYDIQSFSVVVAEKLFQTGTSDSLTISFDLTVEGETSNDGHYVYDYLKVFWVPADTVYQASISTTYFANAEYSTNVIMRNSVYASNYTLTHSYGEERMSVTIANEPNTLKKLVFVWKNDSRDGTQPGAIIDNIYINDCDAPTALAVSNITETSAEVSWNGTTAGYEVRLNGGTPEPVSTTSKTFTGLTAGPAYTVEVRAVCASSQSAWKRIEIPATLPYSCDFEASGNNGWTLKNGTCTNQWHVGSFTSPAGHSGYLFISSDGGTTADYDIYARSVVVAEKLFQTGTSDSLTISFDLTIGGENLSDYLKVYWVNADTVYDASTSWTYYADASYSTNVIMSNADYASYRFVTLLTGTQRMSATIANEPNTLKKLVFVWKNDNDRGTQPGAIIDNIYINDCVAPTALAVSNINETSAEVSWNGTATGYEVRLNGGTPETVSTTSKTFTGLTAGTAYTVEVRAVCASSQSAWTSIEFENPTLLPYTCDFEAVGDNGWTLKNGTCTNQWHVGSFTSPAGHSGSLFISSDGGTTADYDIDARSVVVAEKLFQTGTSDSLTIRFDLTIGGETSFDYLKVYWVNADTVYTAAADTTPYYGSRDYTSNVIMNNATDASYRFVNRLTGTQTMSATIANEANTLKKLVFVWVNDNDGGNGNGAIIDNLSVAEPCDAPTALTVSNITQTSAELSWNGTATGYEVRLNGGMPETVSTTSKTLTGLTAGTPYTVEVRAVCASSQSAWVSTSFTIAPVVVTPPTVETLAATEITHEAATLNGTITAGSEAITAQGFMYKANSAADWTTVAATGTNLSATVNNLTAETAYEYKAFATTASGTVEGAVESFTTLAAPVVVTPPTVETLAATEVTHEAATLNGTITAGSEAITAQGFMYKASSATDWTTVAATGTNLSATVNNLTVETAYEYKAFATTASSTVEGEVINFTTLAASGLADAESGAIKAMIYPNPAKDKATLSLTGLTANAKIIVSDLQGRIIQTEDLQAGTETYELNTSNYASGVYYIRILCGNNSNTQKLIVE